MHFCRVQTLHLQYSSIANCKYCSRQLTWRLHCIVMILARLVTAWFMQRDGKAGIHLSNNILRRVFAPLFLLHTAHVQWINVTLTIVLSRACHTDLRPSWTPFFKTARYMARTINSNFVKFLFQTFLIWCIFHEIRPTIISNSMQCDYIWKDGFVSAASENQDQWFM
jgi:hypothetical protein